MNKVYQDYLAHHGVKGQRWGHRRYQNEDGTLTEEGKQRYGVFASTQIENQASKMNHPRYSEKTKSEAKAEHDRLLKSAEKKAVVRNVSENVLRAKKALFRLATAWTVAEIVHPGLTKARDAAVRKFQSRKAQSEIERMWNQPFRPPKG